MKPVEPEKPSRRRDLMNRVEPDNEFTQWRLRSRSCAVAVGTAQVGRGVVLAAALLVHVSGLGDSDYMNLPAILRHSKIIATCRCRSRQ